MTELHMVPQTPELPPSACTGAPSSVAHVPSTPKPIVVLKALIGGTEQTWYVYGDDDEDVAHKLPRVHRYIQELRKKFGGEDLTPAQVAPAPPPTREIHDCEWHGPMRESTKAPGTWFCPKKKADGQYCPSRWPVRAGEQSA